MNFSAFIFARGGSKGLPGKNIKPLAGKPLIAWSVEQALAVDQIDRVIVSTDDPRIAEIAEFYGAMVPFLRPSELATDASPEWDSWRHAILDTIDREGSFSGPFVSVPTTSPLRDSKDIVDAIALFETGGADVVIAVTAAHRNPWFNMVSMREEDRVDLVNKTERPVTRRQDAVRVYDMTTSVYVADADFVLSEQGMFAGRVKAIEVPPERAIDIDTRLDFEIAEFLMTRKRGEN